MDIIDDSKKDETPKCELKWENGIIAIECQDAESADKVHKSAQEHEVIIRVKTRKE